MSGCRPSVSSSPSCGSVVSTRAGYGTRVESRSSTPCRLPPRPIRLEAFRAQEGWMTQVETPNRATSDPKARKDVLKRIDDEGVEFVLLWFTDIEGHLKS